MAILRRSPAVPDGVRSALEGTSPLAWAPLRGGGGVAATADHLVIVRPDEEPRRVPWNLIDHAEWHPQGALDVRAVDGTSTRLILEGDHTRLPTVLRERVQASLAHLVQRELPGGVTVRAAIRRDAEGQLSSQVTYVGTDRPTPAITRLGEDLEREARSAVGLPE